MEIKLITASLVPGRDEEGDRLVGSNQSNGKYFNYLKLI
jgi:hypothetical protein